VNCGATITFLGMKFHSQKFRVRFSLRQVIRSYISMYASALLRFHLQIRRALLPARPRFVNTPDSAITACVLKPNGLMMRLCKHTKQSLPLPSPLFPRELLVRRRSSIATNNERMLSERENKSANRTWAFRPVFTHACLNRSL